MLGHTKFGTSARHTSFRTRSLGTVSHIQPLSFGPVGLPFQPALLLLLWSSPPESYEQLPKVAPVGAIHQVTSVFEPWPSPRGQRLFRVRSWMFSWTIWISSISCFFFVHNKALFIPVCFFPPKGMISIRQSGAKWASRFNNSIFFAATSKSFLIFEDQLLPAELAQQLFLFQLEKCAATAAKNPTLRAVRIEAFLQAIFFVQANLAAVQLSSAKCHTWIPASSWPCQLGPPGGTITQLTNSE